MEVQPLLPNRRGGQDERAEGRIEGQAHIGAAGHLLHAFALLISKSHGIAAADAPQLQRVGTLTVPGDLVESQRWGAEGSRRGNRHCDLLSSFSGRVPHQAQALVQYKDILIHDRLQIPHLGILQDLRPIGTALEDLVHRRDGQRLIEQSPKSQTGPGGTSQKRRRVLVALRRRDPQHGPK